MSEESPFALCLTHDVDRPYKRLSQSLYYAARERSPRHLCSALTGENPYWCFDDIMALERDLGVRSAFYFLDEPHLLSQPPRAWVHPDEWVQHLGRYDPTSPPMSSLVQALDTGGWEVGIHGSYHTATDSERLRTEKLRLEALLGHNVGGIRQHYLRLKGTDTWRHHADLGFRYDASLGSSETYGFQHGYGLARPFEHESFLVFPLTLMESTLPDPAQSPRAAWDVCTDLLEEAAENRAVMTVLWHPRYFNELEFPGYQWLYRRFIERAKSIGAWIGSPGQFLDDHDPEAWIEAADYPLSGVG